MSANGAPKYVFFSSLKADHFGGFPAYYLSTKMAIEQNRKSRQVQMLNMTLIGPKGLK